MTKPISLPAAFFTMLFGVFLLQTGRKVEFWMIFIPFIIDFLLMMVKLYFRNSGLEAKYYKALARVILKLRVWQIRRQIRNKQS